MKFASQADEATLGLEEKETELMELHERVKQSQEKEKLADDMNEMNHEMVSWKNKSSFMTPLVLCLPNLVH